MRKAFSASVFIAHARLVLLVRHKLLDKWLPVGGELQEGETPLEAAQREAHEETGFNVDFTLDPTQPYGTPAGFIGYEEHAAGPKGLHMNFCFLGTLRDYSTDFDPIPMSDGSWSDFEWVSPGAPRTYRDLKMPANVRDHLDKIAIRLFLTQR